MFKKYFLIVSAFALIFLSSSNYAAADDASPICKKLMTRATGDMIKYSLYGDANGPVFFSGISCAIEYRNREFCAMEMVSFDSTAKVFDYDTEEEIDIGKAFFWLDEKNTDERILAFNSQEAAKRFKTDKGSGLVLDYSGLTEKVRH
jgi:nitrous oxide reductase accessory protein NosL